MGAFGGFISGFNGGQKNDTVKKLKSKFGGKGGGGGGDPSAADEMGAETGGASAGAFKRGGKVRKTGLAKVHKGERVLTKKQSKSYKKRA
jgi:hypothetical protein